MENVAAEMAGFREMRLPLVTLDAAATGDAAAVGVKYKKHASHHGQYICTLP